MNRNIAIRSVSCSESELEYLTCGIVYSNGYIYRYDQILHTGLQIEKERVKSMVTIEEFDSTITGIYIESRQKEEKIKDDKIYVASISTIMSNLFSSQRNFEKTGCTHVSSTFDIDGNIYDVSEDISRSCALYKTIGKIITSQKNREHIDIYGIALSSRINSEIVRICAKTCVKFIISRSAPTELAIEFAKLYGITLCGFVKNDRINVYTNEYRILI